MTASDRRRPRCDALNCVAARRERLDGPDDPQAEPAEADSDVALLLPKSI
jgi:hypothetical protein